MGIADIFGSKGSVLLGKRILVGVTGSVAAIEVPHLIREVLRHSGDPVVVLSKAATRFVAIDALTWCMEKEPYTQISGISEHIKWTSDPKTKVDIFIICPATANTINKIANGIADGPVTLTALAVIGAKIPLVIVPAAHSVLLANPITEQSITSLKANGVYFYSNLEEENKYKFPPLKELIDLVIEKATSPVDLVNQRFLVTGGATREYVDDVRFISNPSTGISAYYIAEALKRRGASVLLVLGEGNTVSNANFSVSTRVVRSTQDMYEVVDKELATHSYNVFISVAAVSDYRPIPTKGKIRSNKQNISLDLVPTIKIIKSIRDQYSELFIVGFKAEVGLSSEELIERATEFLQENRLDMVCANWVGEPDKGFASSTNELFVISPENTPTYLSGSKQELGEKLAKIISSTMTVRSTN